MCRGLEAEGGEGDREEGGREGEDQLLLAACRLYARLTVMDGPVMYAGGLRQGG